MSRRAIHSRDAAAATALAGVVAWLVLASCSIQPSGPPSEQAGETAVPTDQGIVVPGPAEAGGAAGNGDGLPAWIPPGPADPADPPPDGWYAPLLQKDCQGISGADSTDDNGDPTLVAAAYQLCLAVTTDSADAWAAASTDFKSLPAAEPGCLETATYAVLSTVLSYHLTHTGIPVETVLGTGTACPLGLTGVTSQSGDPAGTNPTVPAEGGTELRLVGRFLAVESVVVGGQSVPVNRVAENDFDFVAPPASAPGPVTVTAIGPDGAALHGSGTFSYGETGSPQPEPTLVPTLSTTPTAMDTP